MQELYEIIQKALKTQKSENLNEQEWLSLRPRAYSFVFQEIGSSYVRNIRKYVFKCDLISQLDKLWGNKEK